MHFTLRFIAFYSSECVLSDFSSFLFIFSSFLYAFVIEKYVLEKGGEIFIISHSKFFFIAPTFLSAFRFFLILFIIVVKIMFIFCFVKQK